MSIEAISRFVGRRSRVRQARRLHRSQPDWNLIGHPVPPEGRTERAAGAHRRLGVRESEHLRRSDPDAQPAPACAEGGLRYNRFHVTALCSPTRASLLTGRNNHAVGFGSIGEFAGGFPGYSAIAASRLRAASLGSLRDNGYSTAIFGKWHLTPDGQQGPAGPFDRWPNGWGFDYFYGILGRRLEPVGSLPGREPEDHRHAGRLLRQGRPVLLPRRHGGSDHRVAARRPCPGRRQALLRLLLDRLQPRASSRDARRGPTSTRGSSTRAGTSCARRRSPARRSSG